MKDKQAESCANEQRHKCCGNYGEWSDGRKCCDSRQAEGQLKAVRGRWHKRDTRCEQTAKDTADGHSSHDGLQVSADDAMCIETADECELRENQEVDIGHGDEADTLHSRCAKSSEWHATTSLCAVRAPE